MLEITIPDEAFDAAAVCLAWTEKCNIKSHGKCVRMFKVNTNANEVTFPVCQQMQGQNASLLNQLIVAFDTMAGYQNLGHFLTHKFQDCNPLNPRFWDFLVFLTLIILSNFTGFVYNCILRVYQFLNNSWLHWKTPHFPLLPY